MRMWRLIGWIATGVMTVTLILAFVAGGFGSEGATIIGLTWGKVTLIDLYTGVFLAAAWVWWREERPVSALLWIGTFVFLGNLGVALYVANVARIATNPSEFFIGDRSP